MTLHLPLNFEIRNSRNISMLLVSRKNSCNSLGKTHLRTRPEFTIPRVLLLGLPWSLSPFRRITDKLIKLVFNQVSNRGKGLVTASTAEQWGPFPSLEWEINSGFEIFLRLRWRVWETVLRWDSFFGLFPLLSLWTGVGIFIFALLLQRAWLTAYFSRSLCYFVSLLF